MESPPRLCCLLLIPAIGVGHFACGGEPPAQHRPVAGPFFAEGHDPKPAGQEWVPVAELSDEFDSETIDEDKWQTEPSGGGWRWIGRAPGLFRAENVALADGKMKVTVGPLSEPLSIRGKQFLYQGAIVRSKHPGKVGWYFETRMKANATEMSSTFWLVSRVRGRKQELDIQECIGRMSPQAADWVHNWDQIFHSNLIRTQSDMPGKVQIQDSVQLPTKNHERFYVYAAWWKSPEEVQFFLDGEYAYSLKPDVSWDLLAFIQMAIETYDWNPVPAGGGLVASGTREQRTTQYDWVRVWQLK